MRKSILLLLCMLIPVISGCANGFHPLGGLGLYLHDRDFRTVYDTQVNLIEKEAEMGNITWTAAAERVRLVDFNLAAAAKDYDTSWKFDSNDEEYHQYSIMLASRVDGKTLSLPEYKMLRSQRLNEINARMQAQRNASEVRQNQQTLINNQNRSIIRETINCTTFGNTVRCR